MSNGINQLGSSTMFFFLLTISCARLKLFIACRMTYQVIIRQYLYEPYIYHTFSAYYVTVKTLLAEEISSNCYKCSLILDFLGMQMI